VKLAAYPLTAPLRRDAPSPCEAATSCFFAATFFVSGCISPPGALVRHKVKRDGERAGGFEGAPLARCTGSRR
jgi:hypothetical protein